LLYDIYNLPTIFNETSFPKYLSNLGFISLDSSYRILIIQSINKKISEIIDFNNSLGLLPRSTSNSAITDHFAKPMTSVKEKYQSDAFLEAILLGKSFGFTVDSYFFSLDFGLIPDKTIIPNFDCSISLLQKNTFLKKIIELQFNQFSTLISSYDLIYLAVPEELVSLLHLNLLKSSAPEIVFFSPDFYYSPPLLSINQRELKNSFGNSSLFPISMHQHFKANFLKNYMLAKLLDNNMNFIRFIQLIQEQICF